MKGRTAAQNTRTCALPPRFSDRALGTVEEYNEKVQYIHLNPVRAGLGRRPEDWPWSNAHDYQGSLNCAPATPSALFIDRLLLPAMHPPGFGRAAEEAKLRLPLRYPLES